MKAPSGAAEPALGAPVHVVRCARLPKLVRFIELTTTGESRAPLRLLRQ